MQEPDRTWGKGSRVIMKNVDSCKCPQVEVMTIHCFVQHTWLYFTSDQIFKNLKKTPLRQGAVLRFARFSRNTHFFLLLWVATPCGCVFSSTTPLTKANSIRQTRPAAHEAEKLKMRWSYREQCWNTRLIVWNCSAALHCVFFVINCFICLFFLFPQWREVT